MPALTDHPANAVVKMLMVGDSGSGKSGSLASLAEAGQKLRILDADAGLDVLFQLLRGKQVDVVYETVTDAMKAVGGRAVPAGMPKAWPTAMNLLTHWKMPEVRNEKLGKVYPAYDLGPVSSWGPDTTLVIDSLTFLAKAALTHVLAVNGRSAVTPWQSDWGDAQALVEGMLGLLYSDAIQCNIVMLTHIQYREDDKGNVTRALPMSLGRALSPKVGRFFNTVVRVATKGSGAHARKEIVTVGDNFLELKTPAPGRVKASYPIQTGLAELFRDIRGD